MDGRPDVTTAEERSRKRVGFAFGRLVILPDGQLV